MNRADSAGRRCRTCRVAYQQRYNARRSPAVAR